MLETTVLKINTANFEKFALESFFLSYFGNNENMAHLTSSDPSIKAMKVEMQEFPIKTSYSINKEVGFTEHVDSVSDKEPLFLKNEVGDIHSHPSYDYNPSRGDLKGVRFEDITNLAVRRIPVVKQVTNAFSRKYTGANLKEDYINAYLVFYAGREYIDHKLNKINNDLDFIPSMTALSRYADRLSRSFESSRRSLIKRGTDIWLDNRHSKKEDVDRWLLSLKNFDKELLGEVKGNPNGFIHGFVSYCSKGKKLEYRPVMIELL